MLVSKSMKHSQGSRAKTTITTTDKQLVSNLYIPKQCACPFFRKYLPQLKKFPEKYIYEPWTAPLSVQQAAGCIIGKDYPKPIVVHEKINKINIKRMAEAYARNKAEKDENTSETGK